MKKLFPIIAVVVVGAVVFFFISKNSSKGLRVPLLKKEMSIGTDVCKEFPQEWVSKMIGTTITKTETLSSTGVHVCQYYGSTTSFISIKYEQLSVENIKKGHEVLGRTIETDPRIAMDHFIAKQEDGRINSIYLVMSPNLFIAIDRSSLDILIDNEQDIAFAVHVANRLIAGENVVNVITSPTTKTTVNEKRQQIVVESYLKALSEKRISDAIAMMTEKAVPDDATKQAWGVQFNAFKKLVVRSIEPSMEEEWTDRSESYRIVIDVEMTPESANGPIPYYGYDNRTNTRWITLEKENNIWKVAGISTGP